jgi:hypothetical protein
MIVNSGGRENMRQHFANSYPLPMENLVPRDMAAQLRANVAKHGTDAVAIKREMDEFDGDYYTPGLARKLLGK